MATQDLLITDVTAMSGDAVCIAGINGAGECIRPIFADQLPIRRRHLSLGDGSWIRPRAVVSFGLTPCADILPPHSEDQHFQASGVAYRSLAQEELWRNWLRFLAVEDIAASLGVDLYQGRKARPGAGRISLTTARAKEFLGFQLQENPFQPGKHRYRLKFSTEQGRYFNLPVTDLSLQALAERLWRQMGERQAVSERISRRIQQADETYLRLGLGREFNGWHYLQINGIYTFPDYLDGRCFADFA